MTDDAISDALIVYLAIIEIVELLVDFASFSSFCLTDRLKN